MFGLRASLKNDGGEIVSEPNVLTQLQHWYQAQCNGVWEHSYGVRIDTLDNPGWSIDIDLYSTSLSGKSFVPVKYDRSQEWLTCEVVNDRFRARCGPSQLHEALEIFVRFASRSEDGEADAYRV